MADSTYTVSRTFLAVFGNKRVHLLRYSITAYGTDGTPLTPAIAGMSVIDAVIGFNLSGGTGAVANGPVYHSWDNSTPASAHFHSYKGSNSECDASTNFTTAGYVDALVIGS